MKMSVNNSLVMVFGLQNHKICGEPCSSLTARFAYLPDSDEQLVYYLSTTSSNEEHRSLANLKLEQYSICDHYFLSPLFGEVGYSSLSLEYEINAWVKVDYELLCLLKERMSKVRKVMLGLENKICSNGNAVGNIDSNINFFTEMFCCIAKHVKITHLAFVAQDDKSFLGIREFDKNGFGVIRDWLANSLDLHYHINNTWSKVLRYTKVLPEWEMDLPDVITVQQFRESINIPAYRGLLIPDYLLAKQEEIYRKNDCRLLSEMALRLELKKLQESHLFCCNPGRVSLAEAAFKEFLGNLTNWHCIGSGGWKSYGVYELFQFATFKTDKGNVAPVTRKISAYFSTFDHPGIESVVRIVTDGEMN